MSSGSSARLIARIAVERRLAVLGRKIFHLALADAVLAGAGAVHGERALDQPLQKRLGALRPRSASSRSISSDMWKLPSPTWPTIGATRPLSSISRWDFVDAFGKPRDRHADIGRERAWRRAAAPSPPNSRHAAPATAGCGPRPWSPNRTGRRRVRRRSRRSAPTARRRRLRCRGIPATASAFPAAPSLE